MCSIIPFRAVRPSRDKIALVTSRSYDEYSAAELASQLDYNPFSFLHILHPGYTNIQKEGVEKRYSKVRAKYMDFRNEGVLKQEAAPVFYLYELESSGRTYTGIVAGVALADYHSGKIKKHEDTLEYRVDQFKDYLHISGFNTEPVLLAYPPNVSLERWISERKHRSPLYHFTSLNREVHTLWRIGEAEDIEFLAQTFENIPNLYIADGHHRSASAAKLFAEYGAEQNPNLAHFMSFLISENDVHIHEYNRVIEDLNGHTVASFLERIEPHFNVSNLGHELWKPEQRGQFSMYLEGTFYSLTPKKTFDVPDAEYLYETLLHPVLGIGDLRNDRRISYLPGKEPITKLMSLVDEGDFEVAFALFPATFSEIRRLADNGRIMPPKSTYIEPKFRSGLVIYEL